MLTLQIKKMKLHFVTFGRFVYSAQKQLLPGAFTLNIQFIPYSSSIIN